MSPKLLLAAAAASVVPFAAHAAPEVNGRFAFMSQTFCEAKLTFTKNAQGAVNNITLSQNGLMSSSIGYINFNSSNMTATITGSTLIEGGSLRLGNAGLNWTSRAENQGAQPYSFPNNTTFTYGGQTYKMVFADGVGSNQYRAIFLTRRVNTAGNPNCVENIWASKQPDEV